jgi:hypothetical protein
MGRRYLALPLVLFLCALLLLAALTAGGAIPSSLATPLVAAVLAAMLTGGLSLWGIWMNTRYQIERERTERLREAYAQLLRAGDKIVEATNELSAYPAGRPFPEPRYVISPSHVHGPPTQLDIDRAKHDPFYVETAAVSQALDLHAEAEATIYLEVGSGSPVLERWTELVDAYETWRRALLTTGEDVDALRARIPETLNALREAAHRELRRLITG